MVALKGLMMIVLNDFNNRVDKESLELAQDFIVTIMITMSYPTWVLAQFSELAML